MMRKKAGGAGTGGRTSLEAFLRRVSPTCKMGGAGMPADAGDIAAMWRLAAAKGDGPCPTARTRSLGRVKRMLAKEVAAGRVAWLGGDVDGAEAHYAFTDFVVVAAPGRTGGHSTRVELEALGTTASTDLEELVRTLAARHDPSRIPPPPAPAPWDTGPGIEETRAILQDLAAMVAGDPRMGGAGAVRLTSATAGDPSRLEITTVERGRAVTPDPGYGLVAALGWAHAAIAAKGHDWVTEDPPRCIEPSWRQTPLCMGASTQGMKARCDEAWTRMEARIAADPDAGGTLRAIAESPALPPGPGRAPSRIDDTGRRLNADARLRQGSEPPAGGHPGLDDTLRRLAAWRARSRGDRPTVGSAAFGELFAKVEMFALTAKEDPSEAAGDYDFERVKAAHAGRMLAAMRRCDEVDPPWTRRTLPRLYAMPGAGLDTIVEAARRCGAVGGDPLDDDVASCSDVAFTIELLDAKRAPHLYRNERMPLWEIRSSSWRADDADADAGGLESAGYVEVTGSDEPGRVVDVDQWVLGGRPAIERLKTATNAVAIVARRPHGGYIARGAMTNLWPSWIRLEWHDAAGPQLVRSQRVTGDERAVLDHFLAKAAPLSQWYDPEMPYDEGRPTLSIEDVGLGGATLQAAREVGRGRTEDLLRSLLAEDGADKATRAAFERLAARKRKAAGPPRAR